MIDSAFVEPITLPEQPRSADQGAAPLPAGLVITLACGLRSSARACDYIGKAVKVAVAAAPLRCDLDAAGTAHTRVGIGMRCHGSWQAGVSGLMCTCACITHMAPAPRCLAWWG